MNWAREITLGKASYKAVLMGLAYFHHGKNDECFPSIPTLIQFTELNEKTIRGALEWLRKSGLVNYDPGCKRHRRYILNFEIQSANSGGLNKGGKSSNFGALKTGSKSSKSGGIEPDSNPPKTDFQSSKNDSPILQDWSTNRITGLTGKEITPCSPPSENIEIANRVILALNQRAGKNFKLIDSNRKWIIARLKDDFTETDCLRVIANRVMRWQGTEHAQYLRPETVFGNKFDSYLNDAGEVGTSSDKATAYDPDETTRLLRQMYPDDAPASDQLTLEAPPEWTH